MIIQPISTKLVKIYFFVCHNYETLLQYQCKRFTNNDIPEFTDQEIMTIYLFCVYAEKQFSIKVMYQFIQNYYSDWFPKLPSYVAFCTRLNRLADVFPILLNSMLNEFAPADISTNTSLLDSMPIITCSGKRQGKVARDITDKSFCSTKNLYYYGVKLHALGFSSFGHLPHPESIIISKASENDLSIFKTYWSGIENRTFYGDKIYINKEFFEQLYQDKNSEMLTPIKAVKEQSILIKQMDKAFNDFYSRAVSAVRQPIESLFNWIIAKTDIQRASKVRSTKGLKVHIFGKLVAAFLCLVI